jgi:ParB/RepB/Spo0J family partition protein
MKADSEVTNGQAKHATPKGPKAKEVETPKLQPEMWAKSGQTGAGAKGGLLFIPVGEILEPAGWNSRKVENKEKDAELRADFEDRLRRGLEPVLQPIKVWKRPDGRYVVMVGFRRRKELAAVDPKRPIPSMLLDVPANATSEEIDALAREANLSENANRADLRPWEEVQAASDYMAAHPKAKVLGLAKALGKSEKHVYNMIRLRRQLCPALWQEYTERGESMRWKDLVSVCKLPAEEQEAEYNRLTKELRGGRPKGARDAQKRTRGPNKEKGEEGGSDEGDEVEDPLPVGELQVSTWLQKVTDSGKDAASREKRSFYAGAHHALQAVMGRIAFSPAGVYSALKKAEDEAESEEVEEEEG